MTTKTFKNATSIHINKNDDDKILNKSQNHGKKLLQQTTSTEQDRIMRANDATLATNNAELKVKAIEEKENC